MLPYDASPKAISRRTSYLRVRLAFHLYPQVIRAFCNMLRFGPPRTFTYASTCPWLGHPVSGLFTTTIRPIQARFHYASDKCLRLAITNNSLDRSTKSTPSPDKRAPTPCTHTISGSISLPFRGSFNLSLTVLVHYRS